MQALGGKLHVFQWWLPTALRGTRPGEATGTLHVLRAATAPSAAVGHAHETLTFVAPPADMTKWVEGLQKVSARADSPGGMGGVGYSGGAPVPPPLQTGSSGGVGGGGRSRGSLLIPRLEKSKSVGKGSGVLAGWLQKKGGSGVDGERRNWAKGGRRNWKWRWVVVTNTQFISWYEGEKCKDLKGSLALHGAQVTPSGKPGGFWVLTNNRSLELMAESPEAAERWVTVLQSTANQAPRSMKTPSDQDVPPPPPPPIEDYPGGPKPPPQPQRPPPPLRQQSSGRIRAIVLYEYEPEREEDLALHVGEVVEIISADGDWWVGMIGDSYGSFPSNYVERMGKTGSVGVAYQGSAPGASRDEDDEAFDRAEPGQQGQHVSWNPMTTRLVSDHI